ncbi:PAS domain S-box protein [Solimicrobium silvestre]|uniref:histidine kinase n=1 Tax=Solimicrobium silvestre TaxID=2099400 RepID=A0A2S9H138_9BURK|nr:PAS domain S-box protein [Solimicrobium silvestre]PRC93677.1 PAS domain S-box protein [Solimicrobium silvestre]
MATYEHQWKEEQFRQIVEMAPYAIVLVNERGMIEMVNRQAEKIFGYHREELLKQSLEMLLPERFRRQHTVDRNAFFSQPQPRAMSERGELFGRRKNGTEFPLEIGLNPIPTDEGSKVIATIVDISERVQHQQKLYELTELQQAIFDSTNFSIICTDSNGLFQIFNHSAERLLGYSAEEMVGKQTPVILHDMLEIIERAKQLTEELGTPIETGFETFVIKTRLLRTPDVNEWTYIHKDGSRIPVLLSVTALSDKRGDVSGYVAIAIDLREQKWQLSRIQDSEELFRVLYESSGDAHMLTTPEKGFVGANLAAAKLFGYSTINEFTAQSPATVSPEFQKDKRHSSEKALEMMQLALKNGSHKFEWLHKRADNSEFDAEVMLTSIKMGGKTMLEATVRDITERNRAERIKNEFISTVSHELRTPLTSISGVLSLVGQGVLGEISEQAKPMIQMAHRNSMRLSELINDLLDIEKLEAGETTFNFKMYGLMALINQSIDAISNFASQFNVTFNIIAQEDVQVFVDDGRLIQVLNNFLSNAAKFSPTGGHVDIAVRKIHSAEHSTVRVEIIDHGAGIPTSFRNRLFNKFSQADASDTKKKSGTGLGLAISKELIERMSGVIGFYSSVGEGSCFYFELPLPSKEKIRYSMFDI